MRSSDWSSDVCSSDLFAWLSNRLDIDRFSMATATLHRWPQFKPSVKEGPILPDFDIRLASLSVGRLTIAMAVTGKRQAATLRGRVEILSGRARVDLAGRVIGGEDRIIVNLTSRPDNRTEESTAEKRWSIQVQFRGA